MIKIYLNNNNKQKENSPDYVGFVVEGNTSIPVYGYKGEQKDGDNYLTIRLYESKYPIKQRDSNRFVFIFDKKPENMKDRMPNYTGDYFNGRKNCKMALWLNYGGDHDFKCTIKIKNFNKQ